MDQFVQIPALQSVSILVHHDVSGAVGFVMFLPYVVQLARSEVDGAFDVLVVEQGVLIGKCNVGHSHHTHHTFHLGQIDFLINYKGRVELQPEPLVMLVHHELLGGNPNQAERELHHLQDSSPALLHLHRFLLDFLLELEFEQGRTHLAHVGHVKQLGFPIFQV